MIGLLTVASFVHTYDGGPESFSKKNQSEGKLSIIKVSRMINILHLLFVDDLLIMSRASIPKWQKINKILNAFCCAMGLMINVQKSTFLHYDVHQGTLDALKVLFHFNFMNLSDGFKYLGFFLKPNNYKLKDWQ
jgi:hypothetical protein